MHRIFLLFITLVALVACGGDDLGVDGAVDAAVDSGRDAEGDSGSADTVDDSADSSVDAGARLSDIDKTPDPACDANWMVGTQGRVQREDGTPALRARVQMCLRVSPDERLLCLTPALVDETGSYEIVSPETARCVSEATYRVLVPSEGFATSYCIPDFDTDLAGGVLTPVQDLIVYPTALAIDLPEEGERDAVRTVTIIENLEVDLAPSDLLSGYGQLGVATIEGPTCTTRNAPAFSAVYAFTPEASLFEQTFPIRLPNPTDLAPGSEVDIYVVGGLGTVTDTGEDVDEGIWAPVGRGVVAESGERIEGDGLRTTALTWLGVLPVP